MRQQQSEEASEEYSYSEEGEEEYFEEGDLEERSFHPEEGPCKTPAVGGDAQASSHTKRALMWVSCMGRRFCLTDY